MELWVLDMLVTDMPQNPRHPSVCFFPFSSRELCFSDHQLNMDVSHASA